LNGARASLVAVRKASAQIEAARNRPSLTATVSQVRQFIVVGVAHGLCGVRSPTPQLVAPVGLPDMVSASDPSNWRKPIISLRKISIKRRWIWTSDVGAGQKNRTRKDAVGRHSSSAQVVKAWTGNGSGKAPSSPDLQSVISPTDGTPLCIRWSVSIQWLQIR
jgi:xanthosine utilization system XapX-like protein